MKEKILKVWKLFDSYQKKKFVILGLLALILSLLDLIGIGLIVPFIMILTESNFNDILIFKIFADFFEITSHERLVIVVLSLLLFVFVFKNILNIFIFHRKNKIFFEFYKYIQNKCIGNYMLMPYRQFIKFNTSKLINTLNSEIETFILGVLDPILIIIIETLSITAIFIILIYIEPKGSLMLILLTLIVFTILYKFIGNRLKKIGRERLDVQNYLQKLVIQSLHGIKDIKIVNSENFFLRVFRNKMSLLANKLVSQKILMDSPRFIIEIYVVFFLVILSSTILFQNKGLSDLLVIIGVFAGAGFRIMPSLNRIILATQSLKYSYSVIDLIHNDIFFLKIENSDPHNKEKELKIDYVDHIKFKDVSFRYNKEDENIFENTNITFSKNDLIGIYGESGVGKSTFVDVLTGLLKPTEGKMTINDKIIIKNDELIRNSLISYVPQTIYLNDESISANITFGIRAEHINKNDIDKAIDNAKLRSFVKGLKDKENTVIGEKGVKISGGQRQRIGIARALFRKSEILIFDESTSSLDEKTENEFLDVIKSISKGKIIILISHKPNTLKLCNKIYKIVDKNLILEK
tara:strand:+ start:2512 stop:4248 length:1737 start_codon:yes stop_codon:yes gene_type:complete